MPETETLPAADPEPTPEQQKMIRFAEEAERVLRWTLDRAVHPKHTDEETVEEGTQMLCKAHLKEALDWKLRVQEIKADRRGLRISAKNEIVPMIAMHLIAILEEADAPNYCEMTLAGPDGQDRYHNVYVRVGYIEGITPHEGRQRAETERDAAHHALRELELALESMVPLGRNQGQREQLQRMAQIARRGQGVPDA